MVMSPLAPYNALQNYELIKCAMLTKIVKNSLSTLTFSLTDFINHSQSSWSMPLYKYIQGIGFRTLLDELSHGTT